MGLELIEERAFFVCAGVKRAFRKWTRDGDLVPLAFSPASSSCPDAVTRGWSCGSFGAAADGGPSGSSDLPAVDSGRSGFFDSSMADVAPVVLLHGFAQSSESWREVASLLLESGAFDSVYALDFAGHGKSLRADCGGGLDAAQVGKAFSDDVRAYEMDAACEAVRFFVEFVARREGAAPMLVGYSMGGRIALECLLRYGVPAGLPCDGASGKSSIDQCVSSSLSVSAGRGAPDGRNVSDILPISALVLESAGLGPADETARLALEKRNLAWACRLREEGVASFMDYWQDLPLFESQCALPPERQAAQRAARLANDAEALARTFEGTGAHRQAFEAASLAALRDAAGAGLPVLYLAGSLDAKYRAVARRVAEHVFEGVARGFFRCAVEDASKAVSEAALEVVVVEGAGHNIHLEEPEEFARILGCFAASAGLAR